MQSNEKKLINNTFFLYMMRICNYVFPLITMPYLTRILGAEKYGLYSWGNAIMNYFRLIIDFGFIIIGIELIAKSQDNKKELGKLIWCITILKFILFVGLFVIFSILIFLIPKFQKNTMFLCIFMLPVLASIFNIDYVYQGLEKMQFIAYRTVMTKAIFTILVFVFVKEPLDYIKVPLLTFIGDILVIVIMWKNLISSEKIFLIRDKSSRLLIIFKQSVLFFLSRCAGAIWSSGNTILLGIFCNDVAVAQYSLAFSLICVLQNLITPIADSSYPYMVKNKNLKVVFNIIKFTEPVILICCFIAILVSNTVITVVFGVEYDVSSRLFNIMLGIIVVTLPSCMLGFPAFSALGVSEKANLAVLYAAVFHIIGFIFLFTTKAFSLINVAILTVFTECLLMLFRILILKRVQERNICN